MVCCGKMSSEQYNIYLFLWHFKKKKGGESFHYWQKKLWPNQHPVLRNLGASQFERRVLWQTCGQRPSDLALVSISWIVFFLEFGSFLDTNTGCIQRRNPAGEASDQQHRAKEKKSYFFGHFSHTWPLHVDCLKQWIYFNLNKCEKCV